MTYTTPRTWVAGETVTATLLNTHVRDNVIDLRTAKDARVYATGTQSIPSATWTALTFGAETYDTDAWHSTSSNTERITPTLSGLYLVQANVEWDTDTTGWRAARLRFNSTTIAQEYLASVGNRANTNQVQCIYRANGSTDYFSVQVYQEMSPSASLSTSTTSFAPWLSVTWIGA